MLFLLLKVMMSAGEIYSEKPDRLQFSAGFTMGNIDTMNAAMENLNRRNDKADEEE